MHEVFNPHLVLRGETTRNGVGRKGRRGELVGMQASRGGSRSPVKLTWKCRNVCQCPNCSIKRSDKRGEKMVTLVKLVVMTILESETLSLTCFIRKNKVMNFSIRVKYVGEFFVF